MAKLVSKTYGEALFEAATEENKALELLEEITALRQILKENSQYTDLMLHPGISKQEKLQMTEQIFKGRVSDQLTGFLMIIVDKERFRELDSIFTYYIDKVKESQGIGVAYVTTPMPLDDAMKHAVHSKLLETTEFNTVEMNYEIDSSLIGGMTIRIGDRVVDSSVKNKLEDLTRQLLQIQLG